MSYISSPQGNNAENSKTTAESNIENTNQLEANTDNSILIKFTLFF